MALLNPQAITTAGLAPSYSAANAGGDKVQLGAANVFVHIKNGGASAITVTIPTQNIQIAGLTLPDRAISVPAGSERMVGPIHPAYHGDITNQASLTYSAVTSVTIAALRI